MFGPRCPIGGGDAVLPRTGSEQGAGMTTLFSSASQRLTELLAIYSNERIMQTLSKTGI